MDSIVFVILGIEKNDTMENDTIHLLGVFSDKEKAIQCYFFYYKKLRTYFIPYTLNGSPIDLTSSNIDLTEKKIDFAKPDDMGDYSSVFLVVKESCPDYVYSLLKVFSKDENAIEFKKNWIKNNVSLDKSNSTIWFTIKIWPIWIKNLDKYNILIEEIDSDIVPRKLELSCGIIE